MAAFGQRLRKLRKDRGISQVDLGQILGVTGAAVSAYELDKNQPDFEMLQRIAECFGVDLDYLLPTARAVPTDPHEENPLSQRLLALQTIRFAKGVRSLHKIATQTLPVLGSITAGVPLLSEQHIVGEIEVPESIAGQSEFALQVHGDSMIGAGLQPGDYVFMRTAERRQPRHGDIVSAMIDQGDTTLKRYIKRDGQHWLHAENPAYADIPVGDRGQTQRMVLASNEDKSEAGSDRLSGRPQCTGWQRGITGCQGRKRSTNNRNRSGGPAQTGAPPGIGET